MTSTTIRRALAGLVAVSTIALIISCSDETAPKEETAPEAQRPAPKAPDAGPDAAEAKAFVQSVEEATRRNGEFGARVDWLNNTYINFDSNWLAEKVGAENVKRGVEFANGAKRFNGLDLPERTRRKIEKIKLGVNVPAPSDAGAADELAAITTRISAHYATGAIEVDGEETPRVDLEEMMGTLRDPEKLQEIWTKWREVPVAPYENGGDMKADYARMVEIANAGARELGFDDLGAMWRARYDLPPAEFEAETERLWSEVKPLYDELHCHVRAKLNEAYGDAIVPLDQPIRADLLGNMWAQSWGNIYDVAAPEGADPGYDLTELLRRNDYDAEQIVRTAEAFFTSVGFPSLPETFWTRSQITKPQDRAVACHASAWHMDYAEDVRIKMCTKVNADDFQTVHHELGHVYYYLSYKNQPVLFQEGANGGFHEAIGDMIALSITPEYLQSIGLIEETPDASKDLGLLMRQALEKVAFLPFGLLVDKWRWQVFSGELTPETYNEGWWDLRRRYQGVRPPAPREARYFDPGGKYHVPNNTSYTRYFIAGLLQFQFHKAACERAGWEGPLHRCSIYQAGEVGEAFQDMLALGASRPWPEALEAFTGASRIDGGAMVDYFAPLMEWLQDENAERTCGW